MSKLSVWLSGLVAFDAAAEILEKVGGVHISGSSVWYRSQKWGEALRKEKERIKIAAQEVELRNSVVPGEVKCEQRMGVSMDGAMMTIRGEGWKEFEIREEVILEKQTQEEELEHLRCPSGRPGELWTKITGRSLTQAVDRAFSIESLSNPVKNLSRLLFP